MKLQLLWAFACVAPFVVVVACSGGEAGPSASADAGKDASPSTGATSTPSGEPTGTTATSGQGKLGDPCATQGACESGLCVTPDGAAVGFCANECATQSDCPTGYACDAVTNTTLSVCARLGHQKTGEYCTNIVDCTSNLCIEDGAGANGYCTLYCKGDSECPATWTCSQVGLPSGICTRP